MKKPVRRALGLLFLGSVALGSVALGSTARGQGGDVLVWSTGNSQSGTQTVADYVDASGFFDSVTALDDINAQKYGDLLKYDIILYFSNASNGQDPDAIGNVLADYADTGRRLVIATFSWASQGGNTLGGRIIKQEISPFLTEGPSLYTSVSMAKNDGSQLFDDVAAIGGYFHDDVRLSTGAVAHAAWDDGEVLVASKNNVVAINLFPDDSFGNVKGDYKELFANALRALSLKTNSNSVNPGDTLDFRTARGLPGGLAMLVAIDVGGSPIFANINVGVFDNACERLISASVPKGLTGLAVTFLSFGAAKSGYAEATNPVIVKFQ